MLEKKLLLVEFPWGRDKDPRVPLGHASILAMVSTISDIKCKSFVKPINAKDFNLEQVKREILQELSTLGKKSDIAFGVYVWCEDVVKSILSFLRLNNFEVKKGDPVIILNGTK